MCHAIAGVLTCAKIESIQLDPDEGGATRMRGGIPWITLPAGYLGSSLIGAALITCVSVVGWLNGGRLRSCLLGGEDIEEDEDARDSERRRVGKERMREEDRSNLESRSTQQRSHI